MSDTALWWMEQAQGDGGLVNPRVLHVFRSIHTQPRRGVVDIEAGVWQLVSIPARFGAWSGGKLVRGTTQAKVKEYVVDQLIAKYGAGVVTVCNAYFGDDNSFRSYVPGSTPASSPHNFPLMYQEEDGSWEPVGFWLKSNHGSAMQLDFVEWR